MKGDLVPVEPFRTAFLASGMSCGDLARILGWQSKSTTGDGRYDATRVRRVLGLAESPMGNGRPPLKRPLSEKGISYENAVRLADALGLDYVDVGV